MVGECRVLGSLLGKVSVMVLCPEQLLHVSVGGPGLRHAELVFSFLFSSQPGRGSVLSVGI